MYTERLTNCIYQLGILVFFSGVVLTVEDHSVRLREGSVNSGRVEVYHDARWGLVCSDHFNHNEALVVCRQLGHDVSTNLVRVYSEPIDPDLAVSLHYVTCAGSELTLTDCDVPHWGLAEGDSCGDNTEAWVNCEDVSSTSTLPTTNTQTAPSMGSVRLTGGEGSRSGRVEIFLDGAWGTICDRFGPREAEVICRQLDHPSDDVSVKAGAHFGMGSGDVWQVECSGAESHVLDCITVSQPYPVCDHQRDVGVICGYSDDDLPSLTHETEDTGWRHYYLVAPLGIFGLIGWAIYARCNKKARMKRQHRSQQPGAPAHRRGFGTVSLGLYTSNNGSRSRQSHQPKPHNNRHRQMVTHGHPHNTHNQLNPVESDILPPRGDQQYNNSSYAGTGALNPAYSTHQANNALFATHASGGQPYLVSSSENTGGGQLEGQGQYFPNPASAPKPPAYETEFEFPLPPAYDEIYPLGGGGGGSRSSKKGNSAETNL